MRQHIMKNLKKEILSNLKKLNISHNDSLYLSVNMGGVFLSYFDNLRALVEVLKNKYFYTKYVLKIFKDFISKNGSLICPTFSFSTIKTKKFDIKKTKSDLGIFSQVFLDDKNSLRSDHLIHSLSAIGKFNKIIRRGHGSYSFGINSPFDEFINYKVKFLNIGVPFGKTCSYVHHIEHLNGANHRFYKLFKGKIKKNKKIIDSYCYDFVRFRQVASEKLKNEFLIENYMQKARLISYVGDKIFFSCTKACDVYDIASKVLKKNSSVFLKKNIKILHDDSDTKNNLIKIRLMK